VWWAAPRPVPPALLDPAIRARVARLRLPADRERVATAARLGDLVAGGPVERRAGHAPRVVGGAWLSVSHAGSFVVVASCASARVGVDVEPCDRAVLAGQVARELLDDDELAGWYAASADPAAGLLRTWVRKEAVLKAAGTGLAVSPRTVAVAPPDAPAAVVGGAYALVDLDAPAGAVAALAVAAPGPVVVESLDGNAVLAT
jgi:4'-phosphopantetheinyl transferase